MLVGSGGFAGATARYRVPGRVDGLVGTPLPSATLPADRLLRVVSDLPLVVVGDREEKLAELLPALDERLTGGLIPRAARFAIHHAGGPARPPGARQ